MLQIRLSKGSGSEGGGSKVSGSDNVTVSCPEHLVLAELPVAKGLGPASAVKVVKTVGRKSRRKVGDKVHICLGCDLPIAIYGRLSPCEHAFCLTCARSEPSCYLCDERIQKIQTIKMLEGLFICGAPHCSRSFLKRLDFELHIKETHSDLLHTATDKEEVYQKDVSNVKPNLSDTLAKQPLPEEAQVLSRSLSAPSLPASQQQHPPSESASLRSQPKSMPVSPITSPQEEKQPQQSQSRGSSFGAKQQQDQQQHSKQQTHERQAGYHQQPQQKHDHLGNTGASPQQQQHEHPCNTGASPQQQFHLNQQGSEKQIHQPSQENCHSQSNGEIHHPHPEKRQSPQMGRQDCRQQEKSPPEVFHQDNSTYQTPKVNPSQRQQILVPANPPVIPPPFPSHPFLYSYTMQPEGKPHPQCNPHFDPMVFGPSMDKVVVQASMQNIQDNNQRIPVQAQIVPDIQENHLRPPHVGTLSLPHQAISVVLGPPEGYKHPDRPGPFSHFQGDYGQTPTGMPAQLPHHGMGMGLDQSLHHQDVSQAQQMPPLPKRPKYPNTSAHGEPATDMQNYGWSGVRPNFGVGHGYGSWPGPS